MRTTVTLDPDVAERLHQEMKLRRKGLKATINEALRRGLSLGEPANLEPFRVQAHSFSFLPGLDLDRMNQFVDELEVEEVGRKLQS